MNYEMTESTDGCPTATCCGPNATAFHRDLLPLVGVFHGDPSAEVVTPPRNPTATKSLLWLDT